MTNTEKGNTTIQKEGKKKYIIVALVFLCFLLLVIPLYFYLKNVAIYEPVTIEINDLSSDELQQIKVYGITPLNRSFNFQNVDSSNVWQNGYSFLKTVGLDIPDTLSAKITQISVSIGSKKLIFSVKNLKLDNRSENKFHYVLPSGLRSEGNFIKKIFSVVHWADVNKLFKVFLPVFIVFIVFLVTLKIKKKQTTPRSIVMMLVEKLKQKRILTKKIKTWFKLIFYSLFIACVLFFGFLLLAYTASTYITAILFIVLTGLLIYFPLKYGLRKVRIREFYIKKIRTAIIIFLLIWFCLDTFLRLEGINASHNELQKLFYISGFHKRYKSDKQSPDLLVNPRYYSYIDDRDEFAFEIKTNNEGLRDIDHSVEKPKDEFRIICVGNSFTEGVGTPQDSTWPKLLEDRLRILSKKKITVFNAGNAGSDPFFGYMLLEKRMLKYRPDVVLLAVASSDFNFYRFRGGFERFTPDGYRFRKGPWWEKLYAVSYICRYITDDLMHYKYFFTPEEYKEDSIKAMTDIYNCIHRFYDLSIKENFIFALVSCDDGIYKLDPVLDSLKDEKTIPVIDLAEYARNIEKLTYINRKKYYWPLDGHCNSRGYAMFARGVEWNLKKMGILDTLKKE